MSIAALKKDIDAATLNFRSSAFLADHTSKTAPVRSGITWRNLGEIADASFKFTAKKTKRTTTGKEHQYGVDIELVFTMLQTSDVEFAAIAEMVSENDFGSTFKFSDSPSNDADAVGCSGWVFENAGVSVEGDLDLGGGDTGFEVTITGSLNMAAFSAGAGTPKATTAGGYVVGERVLTFDAA